jgi:hypothetical protein
MAYKDPEKIKAWREANKEERKIKDKAYYEANKELILEQKKAYYEANKEEIGAKRKAYYEDNKEEIEAKRKAYRRTLKYKIRMRAYNKANEEKIKAKKKIWHQENKEERNLYCKNYIKRLKKTLPSVVYMVENIKNNKYYIGQTSRSFKQRINEHKKRFIQEKNDCGVGMQEDYNKYGPDIFEYKILKEFPPETPEEILLKEEQRQINKFIKEGKQLYNKHI